MRHLTGVFNFEQTDILWLHKFVVAAWAWKAVVQSGLGQVANLCV
jgi:hypothetical protein